MNHMARIGAGRLPRIVALGATLVMATAGSTMAGLDTGELPVTGFSHTSLVDETESLPDIYASFAKGSVGVDIEIAGPVSAETTYTLQPADPDYRSGWHYDDGPVIITVTTGTLTFVDDTCQTFDVDAGHTYIVSTGEVLSAWLLPEKNPGTGAVGWFTTRLRPEGSAGPVEVDPPCEAG